VATSPWFALRRDGWLVGGIQLSGLVARFSDPTVVREAMRREGVTVLVLDKERTHREWPRLAPLLSDDPAGWRQVAKEPNWRVLVPR
jgi:hypothetical protein